MWVLSIIVSRCVSENPFKNSIVIRIISFIPLLGFQLVDNLPYSLHDIGMLYNKPLLYFTSMDNVVLT